MIYKEVWHVVILTTIPLPRLVVELYIQIEV